MICSITTPFIEMIELILGISLLDTQHCFLTWVYVIQKDIIYKVSMRSGCMNTTGKRKFLLSISVCLQQ